MKKILKWTGFGVAGLVVFALFAVAGAFTASEVMLRWPVARPTSTIVAARDPAAVERGRKVAVVNGCHDCHGDKLEGRLFHDDALLKAWGPNLTLLASASDADLDVAIRRGVGVDGRRLWIMPSNAFRQLTDQEAADLIAYVRTFRPQGVEQPRFSLSPMARMGVLLGKLQSEPETLAKNAGLMLDDAGPQYAKGRELARACIECHGPQLEGAAFLGSPDLTMVASYGLADFERLLRTGVSADGIKKPGLMSSAGPGRFNVWTSEEIAALHEYLKARAARRVAAMATLPRP